MSVALLPPRRRTVGPIVSSLPEPTVTTDEERADVVARLHRLEWAVGPTRTGVVERTTSTPPPDRHDVAVRLYAMHDRVDGIAGRDSR